MNEKGVKNVVYPELVKGRVSQGKKHTKLSEMRAHSLFREQVLFREKNE